MNCPICSVPLKMTDREGVEINSCPDCRGVWIEGDGLDKIIECSAPYDSDYGEVDDDRGYEQKGRRANSENQARRSFLSRLFD